MLDSYAHINAQILSFIPIFISGLVSVIPFIIIHYICKSIFKTISTKNKDISKKYAISFIASTINYIIIAMAILTVLGTWGLDVRALLAGLGLTGFAVGFALKDVLANSLAGIMIIFYRPLAINSKVIVLDIEGIVVSIDLRYTTIESEHKFHLIPNSKLLSEKITIMKKIANVDESNIADDKLVKKTLLNKDDEDDEYVINSSNI